MTDWSNEERRLLIDEGRRQLDRQRDDLERIRTRAQVLFAASLALGGVVASLYDAIRDASCTVVWVLWAVALLLAAWSAAGAAATAVVRADMEVIHVAVLSRREPPIESELAADYAAAVRAGENAVAVRLTNLRWAVSYLLAAALLTLASWVTASAV